MSNTITEFKFSPLEQFEWWREIKDDEGKVIDRSLIGQYLVGQSYNCTSKPLHDALRGKCKEWEKEGKIKILSLGKGQVFKTINVS